MGYNHNNQNNGFTLIELIMTIVIIVILSVSGAFLMGFFVQNSIVIPKQLNTDMLAADAMDIMIEGDDQAKGLRFCKSISSIGNYQILFTNQDNQKIQYRLDVNRLYRSIQGGPEALIPYYLPPQADIVGKNNRVFTYYASGGSGTPTNNPSAVRFIVLTLIAKTGSGLYADWEGQSEQTSAITVRRFQ